MHEDFEGLDRRVIPVWIWHGALLTGIIAAAGLGGGTIAAISGAPNYIFIPIIVVLLFFIITQIFWYPRAAFSGWSYRISKEEIKIRSGVVFQKEVHVPMDRVQHVDVERGPIERQFGLARLILFTAGTKAAQQEIPGLDHEQAKALRDTVAEYLSQSRRES
jgi:membrane protein YdbS with pleckstrin-like domain